MSQITYADKVALSPQPDVADINKVTYNDMNEIKSAHNDTDNKLTNLITYSTNEQVIGTYKGKLLYRMELSEVTINSSSQSVDLSDYEIDDMVHVYPKYKEYSSGTDYNEDFGNYYISSSDYRRTFFRTLNNGATKSLEYRGKATGVVIYTIEYTKTTD